MISVLLLFVLFAVVQVAVYFYVRNIVAASAASGARYAGALGAAPSSGAARATSLIASSAGGGLSADIGCSAVSSVDGGSGLPVVRVTCAGPLRLTFLPLHSPLAISVSAVSLQEVQP